MLGTLIAIILVYCAYMYLKNLKSCDCVNQTYVGQLANLELIILGLNFLGLFASVVTMTDLLKIKAYAKYVMFGIAVYFIGVLILEGYIAYNVYKFQDTMKSPCKCADKWQKYYIYLQGIFAGLIVLSTAWFSIYGTYLYATGKNMSLEIAMYNKMPKLKRSKRA